jgi:hypothetical protein
MFMIMSVARDVVFELQPLFFIPRMMYEYGEPRWNDIERRKLKKSERNLSQYHFVHHKFQVD